MDEKNADLVLQHHMEKFHHQYDDSNSVISEEEFRSAVHRLDHSAYELKIVHVHYARRDTMPQYNGDP